MQNLVVLSFLLVLGFFVGVYSDEPEWVKIVAVNQGPTNLGAHSLNIHEGKMYVFAGFFEDFATENFVFRNALWSFNIHNKRWKSLSTGPDPRAFHMAAIDHGAEKLYVYGGERFTSDFSEFDCLDDLWVYDINDDEWTEITQPATYPGPRANTQMIFFGGNLYLFGGIDENFHTSSDLWRYTVATNTWTLLRSDGASGNPPPRFTYFATSFKSGTHTKFLIVNGEFIDDQFNDFTYNDSWIYDIQSDTFTNITPANPNDNIYHGRGISSGASNGIVKNSNLYPIFAGEAPGGVAQCGAPFTTNVQNQTWTMDLTTMLWTQKFPTEKNAGDRPVGVKRSAADTKGNSMYLFGGWTFHCVNNVGGQTWPPDVYKLKFTADDDDEDN